MSATRPTSLPPIRGQSPLQQQLSAERTSTACSSRSRSSPLPKSRGGSTHSPSADTLVAAEGVGVAAAGRLASSEEDELTQLKALLSQQARRLMDRSRDAPIVLSPVGGLTVNTAKSTPSAPLTVGAGDSAPRLAASTSALPGAASPLPPSAAAHDSRPVSGRKPPYAVEHLERSPDADGGPLASRAAEELADAPMGVKRAGMYFLGPDERRQKAMAADAEAAAVPSEAAAHEGRAADAVDESADAAEECRLTAALERQQLRMNRRTEKLKGNWSSPPPSVGAIAPADPGVFTAASEDEVREKAAAAEEFAKSQTKLKRRLDANAAAAAAEHRARAGRPPQSHDAPKASAKANPSSHAVKAARPSSGTPNAADSVAGGAGSVHAIAEADISGSGNIFGSFNFFEGTAAPSPADELTSPSHDATGAKAPQPQTQQQQKQQPADNRRGTQNYTESSPLAEPIATDGPNRPSSKYNINEHSLGSLTFGRMSMVSCSIARATDGALAVMEMLSNRPDVVLPAPEETGVVRTGDVLSSTHVLKLDLQDALHGRHGLTGMISGAPYFRIVPKLNIAGVAQANISSIRTIVNELRRAHVEGSIIWVNLREEPLVYINNQAHIVRDRKDPLRPVIIPNVTGRSIEAVEAKLKEEVLQEAYENGGNVSVYVEGQDSLVEDQWECADAQTVFTMKEVFQHLAMRSAGTAAGALHYFRRPITQNVGPQPADFDFVLDACLEEPKAVFVFNCQTGRGRTSAMMQIANIVRFYQLCVKDVSVDVRVLRGNSNTPTFRTIQKLISLFPDGKLHERRLNILMDLADKVYSMSDHINEAFSGMDEHPEEAMMRLRQYGLFLVFSYYCEQRLWNYAVKEPFSQWLVENPAMRILIDSVKDKLKDQLKAEQILTAASPSARSGAGGGHDAHDDFAANINDSPEVVRMVRHRHGNVLSAGRILCSMPVQKTDLTFRSLRQLAPNVPVFTCGRLGGAAREELVREIREAFPKSGKLHWLSLRAEPMIFINDVSYMLTDYTAQLNATENGTTMHLSVQAIEQIEDRLRRDVLLEAQEHGGYVYLHHWDEDGQRGATSIKVITVRTPKTTMEDFVTGCNIAYHRVPIPFSGEMLATDVDPLLRFLEESDTNPHDAIVINDSQGSTRTSVALNIVVLHRAAQLCDLRTLQTTRDIQAVLRADSESASATSSSLVGTAHDGLLPAAHLASSMPVRVDEVPEHRVEPLLASTICQMLTAGSLLRTVDAAIELSGRGADYNVLHHLDQSKRRISVVGVNKPQAILDALHDLRSYLLVLLTSLFFDDSMSTGQSFSAWVREHTEVSNIIDGLDGRGEAALKYVASDNLMKADLSRRAGDVLTANFCLKADHFPGCQKKGLRPELCGAPNFRKVDLLNVYGVAIPTQLGIHNVLALLGALNEPLATYPGQSNDRELFLGFAAPRLFDPAFKPGELQRPLRGSVVWVNLREEPILYVGDRPFVFRDLAAPYVNVELTGIQTDKIELVENQLKVDVLHEAQQYDGKFLVHDEGSPGELVGQWEPASEQTVKTLREVYEGLEEKGARCQLLRLPVTDEQSPDISDFDLLVAALLPRITEHLDRRETLSFVFNCQMGRGRTTTGMVVCCLLIGLVIPEYYEEVHNVHNPLYPNTESKLWCGEYEVIVQLKRVLTQGRNAKYKVDLVLEECSKMQNLRTAIESFATAERSPDNTEAARARAHHAGVHYLIRYFNLVVFAVYLEEAYDLMRRQMKTTFVSWVQQHPELTALSATASLK